MDAAMLAPPTAATPVPDSRGLNLFRADPYAAALSRLYLPAALHAHLLPHLDRLGRWPAAAWMSWPPTPTGIRPRCRCATAPGPTNPASTSTRPTSSWSAWPTAPGLAALSHRGGALGWPEPMPAAAKYALSHLFVQAEFGLCCPVSMTDSLARTLRKFGAPELVDKVLPQVTSLDFDSLRQGAMFMTEQGAGSDVSATEVVAEARPDGSWRLSGDKWFCSNPDAGFAMVLARSEAQPGLKGVSLFLLPRELEDGSHNRYRILRLKDKLGTRSMASGEIRLEGATAWLVGERGRGFKQMADMINNSRLSNGMRAAGLMRRAVTEAVTSQQRRAFGQRLINMPLMRRQLAKMTVWAEQARSVMFQTAQALAEADQGRADPALARILTPLIKFRACRDARKVTGDAMEVRGGCGYIEEWTEPRLVRDAHLGSIWEGTSNIVALDVLRAINRENSLPALRRHVDQLLAEGVPCTDALAATQQDAIERSFAFAAMAAEGNRAELARQAATLLYHAVSIAALRREAREPGLETRAVLADLVLRHRLAARDPYSAPANESADCAAILQYAL